MSRPWKIALLLIVILLFGMTVSLGWSAALRDNGSNLPIFTPKDRELIDAYYNRLLGNVAPGSIDRSPFPLGIEQALKTGSHVPVQLEKELAPLPEKLEADLSSLTGDYRRVRLGRHVLLLRKTDLLIADIIKNVALNVASTH